MSVCVYACMYIGTYVGMCVYVYVYMYGCMYVCVHVCVYVCMYVKFTQVLGLSPYLVTEARDLAKALLWRYIFLM